MSFEIFPWGAMRRHKGERDIEKSLRDIKDCGFTGSCFIEPKDAELCREIGLDPIVFIYRDEKAPEGINEFWASSDGRLNATSLIKDKGITEEKLKSEVKIALSELDEKHAKVYIVDEPGTSAYQRMRWFADAVKEARPDLDLYINLFPNYAVCGKPDMSQLEADTYEEYLDKYCEALPDIPLSVDNYEIIMGMDNQNKGDQFRYYLNLIQCREACDKHGVELHYVVNSNQLRPFLTLPTMDNLMLQAFTVLAAGARSLSWFTYFGRNDYCFAPVDDNGERDIRTPVWYLVKEVNRRALSMGNELFDMKYTGMYFSDTLGLPRAKNVSECEAIKSFSSDLPCMVGMYEDNGEPVAIVVNMSLEHSTKFDISFGDEKNVVWSTEENEYLDPLVHVGVGHPEPRFRTSPMWLAPGDAVVIRAKK